MADGEDTLNRLILNNGGGMKPSKALNSLKLKFESGNEIPVERATITKEEYEAILNLLVDYFQIGLNKGYQRGIEDASSYHLGPMWEP